MKPGGWEWSIGNCETRVGGGGGEWSIGNCETRVGGGGEGGSGV